MSDTEAPPEKPKPTKPVPTIKHIFISKHGPDGEHVYRGYGEEARAADELWGSRNEHEHCWACDGEYQFHVPADYPDPEPAPDLPTEFDAFSSDVTLLELQHYGYCGYTTYSGKRCTNRIQVWFGDAEDELGRVGACGTHAEAVEREFKNENSSIQERQLKRFLENEQERVINVLNNAGIKARSNGYSGKEIVVVNWGVLLAWLDGLPFDFDPRDWKKVAEEKRQEELAKICKTCHKEHPIEKGEQWPQCDQFQPHMFFPRKNNKDLCAICGGPDSFAMHDANLIPKVEGL